MADVVVNTESKNSKELLAQGIRAYVLQDFSTAVAALSKASEIMVAEYGDDLHEALGDVYLYYGKALLGLSREENEALGDAVPRNNEEESNEDEEGDEDNDEENDEAAEEGTEDNGKDEGSTEDNGKDEESTEVTKEEKMDSTEVDSEKTDETKDNSSEVATNGTSKAEASGSAVPAEDTEDSEDKPENDEDPTDLQVAWEVLEIAKKIFEKLGDNGRKNLAETLTVLGEISLESENFEAAINDITDGLQIQKELFEKDSRTVAETYYKLGVAYSTNSQIEQAIENFNFSLEYLRNRVKNLEEREDKKDGLKEEIEEIKNLIPDIEEKIVDMKSYKAEALKKIVSAVTEAKPLGESSTSEASSSKPATNISHLVKRKRKLDEITDEKESIDARPAKK